MTIFFLVERKRTWLFHGFPSLTASVNIIIETKCRGRKVDINVLNVQLILKYIFVLTFNNIEIRVTITVLSIRVICVNLRQFIIKQRVQRGFFTLSAYYVVI